MSKASQRKASNKKKADSASPVTNSQVVNNGASPKIQSSPKASAIKPVNNRPILPQRAARKR